LKKRLCILTFPLILKVNYGIIDVNKDGTCPKHPCLKYLSNNVLLSVVLKMHSGVSVYL